MPPAGIGRQILDTAIAEVGQANRIGGSVVKAEDR